MSEHLFNHFTLNETWLSDQNDGFFYHEMMSHPALFTHPHPKKIAVTGMSMGIVQEILKHPNINEICCISADPYKIKNDTRVTHHCADPLKWLEEHANEQFDVIIQSQLSEDFFETRYACYYRALAQEGILVQPCPSPLLHIKKLNPIFQHIKQVGFRDWQVFNFPQPSSASGWHGMLMTTKRAFFKRVHEKDIFNRAFTTHYYNYDIHKAALALPEYVRQELTLIEGL